MAPVISAPDATWFLSDSSGFLTGVFRIPTVPPPNPPNTEPPTTPLRFQLTHGTPHHIYSTGRTTATTARDGSGPDKVPCAPFPCPPPRPLCSLCEPRDPPTPPPHSRWPSANTAAADRSPAVAVGAAAPAAGPRSRRPSAPHVGRPH